MKTPLLCCLLLLLTIPSWARTQGASLRVEPAEVSKTIEVDNLEEGYEDVTTFSVTNDSRRMMRLSQELVRVNKPRSWDYSIFSRKTRSAPYVMDAKEMDNDRIVQLAPGESAFFYVVLRPDGVLGEGSTEVRFYDLATPGSALVTTTFTTQITRRPATRDRAPEQRPAPTTVNLYPNPARERFFIESPANQPIGRVEISNTLGRMLKRFDRYDSEGYDIEKLPDGLYLISIYDPSGKKLKTLRLLHRQFGA